MKVRYSLRFSCYYDWSAYGSSYSSGLLADSMDDLKKQIRDLKQRLKKQFKRIEFGTHIRVEIEDMIPVEALTKQVVRRRRK